MVQYGKFCMCAQQPWWTRACNVIISHSSKPNLSLWWGPTRGRQGWRARFGVDVRPKSHILHSLPRPLCWPPCGDKWIKSCACVPSGTLSTQIVSAPGAWQVKQAARAQRRRRVRTNFSRSAQESQTFGAPPEFKSRVAQPAQTVVLAAVRW